MKLPFMKKKTEEGLNPDKEYHKSGYSLKQAQSGERGRKVLARIMLYGSTFVVFVAGAGGYYYLNFIRASLNETISNNPPSPVKAINIGREGGREAFRDESFAETAPNGTERVPEPSASHTSVQSTESGKSPGVVVEPVKVKPGATSLSGTPPSHSRMPQPRVAEKDDRGPKLSLQPSPDVAETLLDQLVLRDDNPFRDKFLKRYNDSHTPRRPQKENRLPANTGQLSRSSKTGRGEKTSTDPATSELNILPAITGGKLDLPGGFKVFGVIRTQDTSIALTNRGELKVGSLVDGDSVTEITMNEVYLKSGRIFKVSAQ